MPATVLKEPFLGGDVPSEELEDLALRFALQNAIDHEGQANQGAVIGRIMAYDDAFKDDPEAVSQAAADAIDQIGELSVEEQEAQLEELGEIEMEAKDQRREGLPELPNTEGRPRIVMRFAPNPNGPPTLGHSRGMCINGWYARRYRGDLILRFDDTDPVNKPPWEPAYDMFEDAFEWLDIEIARTVKASDRMDTYYDYAMKALVHDSAYVCTCSQAEFKELKDAKEPCPHRDDDMANQLDRWEKMRDGTYEAGDAVVRIKTDIEHKDPALRDWVALRIVDIEAHPHAQTGTRRHVWPMLDFESAIEDHLLGVTHIIRGKDLADSEKRQRFLYDHFGWRYPEVLHWGRVSVHGFGKFSTSQLREDIEAGKYTGWDDPRLPTLAALARRGFQPEAIMQFWVDLGLTEKDIAASMETLEAENRKLLDPRSDRLYFVKDPAALRVNGLEGTHRAKVPRHPDHANRGTRTLVVDDAVLIPSAELEAIEPGTVFRLKEGMDLELVDGQRTTFVSTEPSEDRDGPMVEWVTPEAIRCTVITPEGTEDEGAVEKNVLQYDVGDIVQFERYGFVRLEHVSEGSVRAVYTHA